MVVNEEGVIVETGLREAYDPAELEIHNGVLVPGFINSHCHLELSFMKGQIPEKTGLLAFVRQVVAIRDRFSEDEQQAAIKVAEREMAENGIVAVGDISNDTRSFAVKQQSALRFHTFVEVFDLGPAGTGQAKATGQEVYEAAPKKNGHTASITPHAPYSCSMELFRWCDSFTAADGRILSIHLQEQADENRLFMEKAGAWVDLFRGWGLDFEWFRPTGKSSLQSVLPHLGEGNTLLFVHNTFTKAEDIAKTLAFSDRVYWCFCPNANLYIENRLPDYRLFLEAGATCVIGTDSLASNHQLSVLEEMKVIQKNAPYLTFETLLRWATLNGAEMLGFQRELGSFEAGKKPGVNLVSGMNMRTLELTGISTVRRLA